MVILINTKFISKIRIKFYIVVLIFAFLTAAAAFCGYAVLSEGCTAEIVRERAELCYENVLNAVDPKSFALQIEDNRFTAEKHDIQNVRAFCGALAVYTVAYSESGKSVYILTSFADGSPREGYRKGTEVDAEVLPYITDALNGNINFKKTKGIFGKDVYICVYPVTDAENGIIVGAVGMEFDFSAMWEKMYIPSIFYFAIMAAAILALVFSITLFFKKYSAKIADNISNTDQLTGLGNRIAYKSRIEQLDKKISDDIGAEFKIFAVLFSINDLSVVNDTLGTESGDTYIKDAAELIRESFKSIGDIYRISGDEFAVISEGHKEDELRECLDRCSDKEKEKKADNSGYEFSIAYGYSGFVNGGDADMKNAIKRAGEKMRRRKQESKQKSMRVPR